MYPTNNDDPQQQAPGSFWDDTARLSGPPLTGRYTRMALTQRLRCVVEEGGAYGLVLEVISAADVARSMTVQV